MKLSAKGLGLSMGVLWGVTLFVSTLVAVYSGYLSDQLSTMIVGVYPWYELSLAGAFIGLGEGFVDGFVGGVILAWLYNFFACCCCKKECECCKK